MYWKAAVENHAAGHVQDGAVHAFRFPVRCWIVRFSSLPSDASVFAEEVNVRIFSSTICAEDTHAAIELSLKMTYEVEELLCCFVLRLR